MNRIEVAAVLEDVAEALDTRAFNDQALIQKLDELSHDVRAGHLDDPLEKALYDRAADAQAGSLSGGGRLYSLYRFTEADLQELRSANLVPAGMHYSGAIMLEDAEDFTDHTLYQTESALNVAWEKILVDTGASPQQAPAPVTEQPAAEQSPTTPNTNP